MAIVNTNGEFPFRYSGSGWSAAVIPSPPLLSEHGQNIVDKAILAQRAAMIEFIVENAGWIGEARELGFQFLGDAYEVETRWCMYHADWEEEE